MDAKEWMELPLSDILEKEKGLRKELFNLRFQKTLSQLANPMRIREVRHEIARVLTFIRKQKQ